MPVDRGSDAFRRFERALDGLKAGPGAQAFDTETPSPAGSDSDPGPRYGHDQGIQMDDFVQDTVDTGRASRRRSPLMPVGIALLVLAAFGGVVWFAYSDPGASPDGSQTVELIQADPEPVKTRPENPGGMKVEHQDKLILNPDPEKPQVERLLPPPEVPLPVPAGGSTLDSDSDLDGNEETPLIITEQQAESVTKEVEAAANTATSGASAAATSGNEAAGEGQADAEKVVAAPKIPDAPAVKPKPVAQVAEVPKPTTTKAPAPKATTQLAKVPTDSGYVLQLASLRSEQIALQEWKRIQNANKGLLAQMKAIVEKAEIDGIGTRFRLQTGPFPTKATAQDLCAQLKAAKQDCLVKRR